MKRHLNHLAAYVISMVLALGAIFAILNLGPTPAQTIAPSETTGITVLQGVQHEIIKNLSAPITLLIVQVLAILLFCRLCSFVLKSLGQAQVVGEMVAGILLGKSVLGYFAPATFAMLFPENTLTRLYFLSHIGLLFFMFVVGLDLRISDLKNRASAALLISHVSIVLPFLLGTLMALAIYGDYGPPNFAFSSFALFMGIAMSITAFPVLARILQEKRLTETSLGAMALTCAAVDDVTAWCILAAVLGIVKAGTGTAAAGVLLLALIYVIVMWKIVRPAVAKILRPATVDGNFSRAQVAFVFSVVLGSALVTEIIGIHALFGAFLAGTIMPQSLSFRSSLIEKIEDLCSVLLLPIFFAYTGIRMQIGMLNSVHAWFICGVIIFLAIAGKFAGSSLAARWSGLKWRDSLALGSLMNTRGLMELVVLNIGYDIGILSPTIFAMMVIMAVFTTTMTGPLLMLFLPHLKENHARGSSGARSPTR